MRRQRQEKKRASLPPAPPPTLSTHSSHSLPVIQPIFTFKCPDEPECECRALTQIDALIILTCEGRTEVGGCHSVTQTLEYHAKSYHVRFLWNPERMELESTEPEYDSCSEGLEQRIIVQSTSLNTARIKFVRWIEISSS